MSTRSLKVNFVFNLLGPLIRLAVALVTIPIYIHYIGDARYGIVSIAWVMLGYFGFLDLGLSRAAVNALAKLRDAPQNERARVLFTTIAINSVLGVIGGAILFIFGAFILTYLVSIPIELKPEITRSFPWIACLFPMTLISSVAIGALESRDNFLLANILQTAGFSFTQVAPVIAAMLVSPSLAVVIPVAALAQAANVLVTLAAVNHIEGLFAKASFGKQDAVNLLRYGGWVSVSNLAAPLLVTADQFLIGAVLGVAAVAHYSVAMNLVSRSLIFPGALMRTFFPRMSSLSAEEARRLAARAFTPLAYVYAAICAPAMILAPVFFRYWVGREFAEAAAPVAVILFFGAWINGLAFVAFTLLQSQGRVDLVGKFHAAQVVPFLAVLWGLTSAFGLIGAAVAWSLRCLADASGLLWAAGMLRRELVFILFPAFIIVMSAIAAQGTGSRMVSALALAAVAGLSLLGSAFIVSEEWRNLMRVALARMQFTPRPPV